MTSNNLPPEILEAFAKQLADDSQIVTPEYIDREIETLKQRGVDPEVIEEHVQALQKRIGKVHILYALVYDASRAHMQISRILWDRLNEFLEGHELTSALIKSNDGLPMFRRRIVE